MNEAAQYRDGLALLQRLQEPDGSFAGWASSTSAPFVEKRKQPTSFPTMLIASALSDVPGAETITRKAASYIAKQGSRQKSWGYWDRASSTNATEPYPDDLDDTACALSALHAVDPSLVSATDIGAFARLLVASELKPGGPYNTWLIDYKSHPQWEHIDIAVNANIGRVLSQHGASPSGLQKYIADHITQRHLQSAYYVGDAPVLYFLSQWYTGPELKARVSEALTAEPASMLRAALLVTAAQKLGIPAAEYVSHKEYLKQSYEKDRWQPEAFYIDPAYDSVQHYGGSTALTVAFVLQALYGVQTKLPTSTKRPMYRAMAQTTDKTFGDRFMRGEYSRIAKQIVASDAGNQIAAPASIVADAGKFKIAESALRQLNQASLHGWIAYTIYDDFLDGEGNKAQLSIAHMAHRKSVLGYLHATNDERYKAQVTEAFDAMDVANAWELKYARANLINGYMIIGALPDYGEYEVLARRSWGHSLAASGVLCLTGKYAYDADMQRFFKHFLIARQLNDDAHDWEDDMRNGHLSCVVTMLLKTYGPPRRMRFDTHIEPLRQLFWQTTIDEVSEEVVKHIKLARNALTALAKCMDSEPFEEWLQKLEQSVVLARKTRDETNEFIRGFGGNNDRT